MSAYITLATPMTDQECLLDALAELGFGPDKVEVHEEAVPLSGYQRGQRANVILRKAVTQDAWNDIGFEQTGTGFKAIISDDHPRFGRRWVSQVARLYQEHHRQKLARLAEAERRRIEEERRRLVETQRQEIHKKAKKMGYRVQETREGDKLRLVLVKRVY